MTDHPCLSLNMPAIKIAGVVPSFFAERILNAIPSRIAVLDASGTIVATNAGGEWCLPQNGWVISELEVGSNYLDACETAQGEKAAELQTVARGIRSVLDSDSAIYTQEYALSTQTGNRWFQMIVTPIRDEDMPGAVVIHNDITARHNSEEASEANQARLHLLADIASEIVSRISIEDIITRTIRRLHDFFPDHQAIYATINTNNILRVTHSIGPAGMSDLTGMEADLNTVPEYLHALQREETVIVSNIETSPCISPLANAMQRDGIHALLDVPLPHPNEQFGLLCLNAPRVHPWSEHEITTIQEVAQYLAFAIWNADIQQTHLRTAEALRFSNARLNLIARVTGAVIGTAPLADQAREMAEHMRQAFEVDSCVIRTLEGDDLVLLASVGVPENVLTTRIPAYSGLPQEILTTLRPLAIANIHEDPRTRDITGNLPNAYRFISYAGAPLLVENRVIGILGIYARTEPRAFTETDLEHLQIVANHVAIVIENNRLYRELALQKEQLLHAQKMEGIGRLAGGIAHDFNNLLTAILGFAELISDNLARDNPNQTYLAQIQKAGNRAADLTRQLLTFARKQIIQPRVICLNSLLENMEQMLRPLIGEDIELVIRPTIDPLFVRIDPGQCEQILVNLVVNARDAMPSGGALFIQTDCVAYAPHPAGQEEDARPPLYAMLAITDTGTGMDEDTRAHIFEPFFTTKEVGKGTGLGLATCYGIITQAGGHITVASEANKGTTFRVYLPLIQTAMEPQREQSVREPVHGGHETVLLVEDETQVRDMATTVLRNQGYTVLSASDGREAMQQAELWEGNIHLLLTDVVMPYMSGREVAQRLLATHPHLQVLYVSGYTENASLYQECLLEGEAFLSKPFTPMELSHAVHQSLQKLPLRK